MIKQQTGTHNGKMGRHTRKTDRLGGADTEHVIGIVLNNFGVVVFVGMSTRAFNSGRGEVPAGKLYKVAAAVEQQAKQRSSSNSILFASRNGRERDRESEW